jgi:hypothetical protein
MNLRNRLLPVGALVVGIGASAAGAATAAETGKGSKGDRKAEPDWDLIAGKLGVTAQQAQDARVISKPWIGQADHPTPDMFLQHFADLVHQPVDKGKKVLYGAGVIRDESAEDKAAKADADAEPGDKPGAKTDAKTGDENPDQAPDKASDQAPAEK